MDSFLINCYDMHICMCKYIYAPKYKMSGPDKVTCMFSELAMSVNVLLSLVTVLPGYERWESINIAGFQLHEIVLIVYHCLVPT